jgi:hypothetical protein
VRRIGGECRKVGRVGGVVWTLQERVARDYICIRGSKKWNHLQVVTRYDHSNPSLTSGAAPVTAPAWSNFTGISANAS